MQGDKLEALERLKAALADADRMESIGVMVKSEDLRAALASPPVSDGGEFVMVPREATEAMLDAAGLVDIEIYPTNVPSGLTATNRREARAIWKEMLAASPSRPSPSAEQREAALHAAVRATYPGRSLHADPIQDTERAYWNPLLDAILAALYPDRGE